MLSNLCISRQFVLGLSQDVVNPTYISGSKTIQDERPVSDGQINFSTGKSMIR